MMNWAAEKCDDEKSSRSPAVFRRRHLHRRKHTLFPVPLPARAKRRQGAMSYLDPTARSRARAEHSVSSEIGRDMRGNRVVQEGVWSEYVRKDPSHQQQKRSLFDGPPPKRNPSDVGGDELFGHLSCRVLPNPDAQRRGEYQGRRTTDLTPFVDLAAGPQARSRASRMVFREASIDEGAPADAPSPDEPTGVGAAAGEQDALQAFMNKQQSELNARPGGGAGGHGEARPEDGVWITKDIT